MVAAKLLRVGFIVNPFAGVGGPAANKGSDDEPIQHAARSGSLTLTALPRVKTFLEVIKPFASKLQFVTIQGLMGAANFQNFEFNLETVNFNPAEPSTRKDTQIAVGEICNSAIDILVFVGGDGTARDVCDVLPEKQIVLGVPAGVKMHSGVYAINPQSAAALIACLAQGELVNVSEQEVRDIDEEAFRQNVVRSRYYGEMCVPSVLEYVQHVKQGGIEVDELVLIDMAETLREELTPNTLLVFGPGSTMLGLMDNLTGKKGTLLGVDVCLDGQLLAKDANAEELLKQVNGHDGTVKLLITAIGGQGHIIGRGNQQIGAALLSKIGQDNTMVVATKGKLQSLEGRPLLVDSGDKMLDSSWCGHIQVLTGYRDWVLYRVSDGASLVL